jgi:hypothetical protein
VCARLSSRLSAVPFHLVLGKTSSNIGHDRAATPTELLAQLLMRHLRSGWR